MSTDAGDGGSRSRTGAPDFALEEALTAPLLDPSFYAGDPYPAYAELRSRAPLAWNDAVGCWVASRHADVVEVSRDPRRFCSGQGIMLYEIGATYDTPPTMMHTDPPDHTRYRALVTPGFRPSFVRSLEPMVRRRTADLLAGIEPGEVVDVVGTLAVPLALQVISDLLGIPEDEWPRFHRWSDAVIPGAVDMPDAERDALRVEMVGYLLEAAARRRVEPAADIITELVAPDTGGAASDPASALTDAELAMFLVQLLVAGNETTRNLISGGLAAFAAAPEQWHRLRERSGATPLEALRQPGDRSPVAAQRLAPRPHVPASWQGRATPASRAAAIAVEEMLRYTTPVVSFMRTAVEDTVLAGRLVAAGQPVLMLYASANRDEDVFGPTAPDFDAGREPNPHIAFGFGPHFCIGAVLARLEGRVLLEELIGRFTSIEPAGAVERTPSPVIAGIRSAPVRFGRA
ncbi:MAG: cytochrome P450 [Actinomycetota bacterium]|jgi:cytochrome P450|nr:cytochrome P450 [Actinomycetota bacterium]